ncbi:hypothetical protein ACFL3M_00930 [Patescibacteria group bacterium]
MREMKPYIGITDFEDLRQVEMMRDFLNYRRPNSVEHRLHVGVMMSHKSLYGIPGKYTDVFPVKESLPGIFSDKKVFNCLHYADYVKQEGITLDLLNALSHCGDNLDAIQLDMVWPDRDEIVQVLADSGMDIEVILQIGQKSFEKVWNSSEGLIEKLSKYDGVITRVLLDQSMGRGIEMDASEMIPIIEVIKENFPHFGVVVAGGLGPESTHVVEPILRRWRDVSVDAQSKLRFSGNLLDSIDWSRAKDYVRGILSCFNY